MKLNEYIEITNEDNMDLMKRYPDKYFDIAIIDPPYGIDAANMNLGKGGGVARNNDHKKKDWDKQVPTSEYWEQLFRVSKNQIVWGGNYYDLPKTNGWIIWKKMDISNDFNPIEMAWTSNLKMGFFDFLWAGMWQQNMKNKELRIHPTQKPVALYAWILKKYAKQGDKILDTHFGSGSIACAVHKANIIDKMDLSLVACELDKDYFESSIQRVKEALQTQSLF